LRLNLYARLYEWDSGDALGRSDLRFNVCGLVGCRLFWHWVVCRDDERSGVCNRKLQRGPAAHAYLHLVD
jgi:hypothetical protein